MVLFLFVIMMLDVQAEARTRFLKKGVTVTIVGICLLGGEMLALLLGSDLLFAQSANLLPDQMSSVGGLGEILFTEYLFPFEVASVILLTALVGAIILTRQAEEGR